MYNTVLFKSSTSFGSELPFIIIYGVDLTSVRQSTSHNSCVVSQLPNGCVQFTDAWFAWKFVIEFPINNVRENDIIVEHAVHALELQMNVWKNNQIQCRTLVGSDIANNGLYFNVILHISPHVGSQKIHRTGKPMGREPNRIVYLNAITLDEAGSDIHRRADHSRCCRFNCRLSFRMEYPDLPLVQEAGAQRWRKQILLPCCC